MIFLVDDNVINCIEVKNVIINRVSMTNSSTVMILFTDKAFGQFPY